MYPLTDRRKVAILQSIPRAKGCAPMRINPFYDAWLFLSGQTGEHAASGIGWLLTALFLALLAGSIWIAWRNWRHDRAQRTSGPGSGSCPCRSPAASEPQSLR